MSTNGFNGLFGRDLLSGDFIIGKEGKTSIDSSEFGIITPNQTLFKKEYSYYLHKNDDFDVYKNLTYFDMVESKTIYSGYAYKLEKMDEYESYIYNKYIKFYDLRMKGIEYYKKNKNYLPIGSIISERLTFRPYLFLGICSSIHKSYLYRTYNTSGQVINPNNYLICSDTNEKLYCYLDLSTFLKSGLSIENLINGKLKLSSFLLNNSMLLSSRFVSLSSPKSNCYYIGKADISDFYLHNYFALDELDFYGNLYGFKSIDKSNYLTNYYYSKEVDLDKVVVKKLYDILDFNHKNTIVLLDSSSSGTYRIVFFEDICDRSHKLKKL